jgi:hypothetical protein
MALYECGIESEARQDARALPVTALQRRFNGTILLTAIILVECAVLAFNQGVR